MKLTVKLEAVTMICMAGIALGMIGSFADAFPEIRMFAFYSTIIIVILLLTAILSAVIISFRDEQQLTTRELPSWSCFGFMLISIGVGLYGTPLLGVIVVLVGLALLLSALYYREKQNTRAYSDSEV